MSLPAIPLAIWLLLAAPAAQGQYAVVSNSYGSTTSGVATVSVEAPPSITTQPASESRALGGVAAFSVKAAGAPLTYQWIFDGGRLSDNGNISGSASNQLTVNLVASNNAGSYSVIVANSFVSVTSSVVQLTLIGETSKPSVAIASPAANSRTNAPVLSGTASDSVRVRSVAYWVTNVNNGVWTALNGQAALTAGTGAVSNWTIQRPLLPGTNILAVQSSNYAGLASPMESATFFYQATTRLQLAASPAGMGTVTGVAPVKADAPPSNGAALFVGEGYTVTANPACNWYLTNWMTNGTVAGTNTSLAFIMESNLVVTANFATNLFVGTAARYDGIFYLSESQGASEATSGLIENLLLNSNGVYSGKLYLAGTNYALTGGFDRSGQVTETINRSAAAGGNLTLQLSIPWQIVPRQISGAVQGTNAGGWISRSLRLYAATTNTNNFPAYTALLAQDPNLPGSPPSYGYALITNSGSMIALGGVLSDGTPFSRSEPINEQDEFPVYASLYNNTGLLLGQMSLSAATYGAVPAGNLTWIKPPSPTGLYANGFSAGLAVEGSPWISSAAALSGLFANGAPVTFSGGGLASNLVSTVQLTSSNTLRRASGSTNFAGGTINRSNGLMTLAFTNTSGKKVTASGTLLQNAGLGGGFFLGATNAGAIVLQPLVAQTAPVEEDAQIAFYANLIGLEDARLIGRLDSFVTAIKQAGLYSNIIDGVLLRTNWQASPERMVTFFGKSVTNNNATFAASGVVFDGATSWLKFPCALPGSNTVYCLCQNNSASNAYGSIWTAYSDADTLDYTYATSLMQNLLNNQEYDFVQWTNTYAANFVVPTIPREPWQGVKFHVITADYFRHSFTLALNGGTDGYSMVDGQTYSLANGVALPPLHALDTVAIGYCAKPAGAGLGGLGYFPGTVQQWWAFNCNLTAGQVKAFENALMWLDPETSETIVVGDSRTGNQFDYFPDTTFPALMAQSSLGAGNVCHRYCFPGAGPYAGNTNWPDCIPQQVNLAACPNVQLYYLMGINAIPFAPAAAIAQLITNDLAYFSSLGMTVNYMAEPYPTNTAFYTPTNIAALNAAMRSNAAAYDKLIPLDLILTNMANPAISPDGLHFGAQGCTNIVLYLINQTNQSQRD